jgi:hypothetical protein
MSVPVNPYFGLPHAELCGLRRDYAKMLHAASAARKTADKHLQLIKEAMRDDGGTRDYEASDHAVIRYLERVQGVDVNAIRDTITFNCSNGSDLIGDKMRGADGFLYCLNGDGHVTTILPLGAVVEEISERAREQIARASPNGKKRRSIRAKMDFIAASGMSASGQDPKGLEAKPASPVTPKAADAQDTPHD